MSVNQYLIQNTGLIHKFLSTFAIKNPADYDEYYQVCLIALWKAYESYDGRAEMSTWAWHHMRWATYKLFKKQPKEHTLPISIDTPYYDKENIESYLPNLSVVERTIFDMKFSGGHTFKEIGQTTSLNARKVGRIYHKIIHKISQAND